MRDCFSFKSVGSFPPKKKRKTESTPNPISIEFLEPLKAVTNAMTAASAVSKSTLDVTNDMAHAIREKKTTLRQLSFSPLECVEVDVEISNVIMNFCKKRNH